MAIISYSSGGSNFQNSYLKQWLNDTSVDGFLGNLRNPESFLKMDSTWNLETFSGSLNNINKPNNKYKGLNEFKLNFHANVIEYIGDFELITNSPLYFVYKNSFGITGAFNKTPK